MISIVSEHIWHTELDFMFTHRDRHVILSFMQQPYQNVSQDDSRDYLPPNNNNNNNDMVYEKTHLVEKFYPGNFDDIDMFDFDTHEKLEVDSPSSTHTTLVHNKVASASGHLPNTGPLPENKRQKNGNRHNNGRGGGNRKNTNRKDPDGGETPRPNNRREKSHRRGGGNGEDFDEKLELRPNKKFDFDRFGDLEVSTVFEAPKNGRKQTVNHVKMHETVEEPPLSEYDEQRKPAIKDSNIHIVRPMSEPIVPSTPLSTDSKIIEIKPSNGRNSAGNKKIKRFSGDLNDASAEGVGEYRRILMDDDDGSGNGGVQIEAAALVSSVPTNISTGAGNLNGFAGSIQRYLQVEKEIGNYRSNLVVGMFLLYYYIDVNFGVFRFFFCSLLRF